MNIGFLGTGHITYSIILGIFKSNLKIKKIYISPRNKFIAKKLSKRFKKVFSDGFICRLSSFISKSEKN